MRDLLFKYQLKLKVVQDQLAGRAKVESTLTNAELELKENLLCDMIEDIMDNKRIMQSLLGTMKGNAWQIAREAVNGSRLKYAENGEPLGSFDIWEDNDKEDVAKMQYWNGQNDAFYKALNLVCDTYTRENIGAINYNALVTPINNLKGRE